MAQQQFTSPYRKNASELKDLTLWTKNNQGKAASFRARIAGNKARLKVYPGIEGDNKAIDGILKPADFFGFLSLLDWATTTPADGNDHTAKLVVMRPMNGKAVTDFELFAGRNKDGLVWFSLYRHDRPKIAFTFNDDNYRRYEFTTGEQASRSAVSNIMAKGYIRMMENMAATLFVTEFVEEEENNNRGGNNGGYGGRNGYNGGGYNNRSNNNNGGNNADSNHSGSDTYPDSGNGSSGHDYDDDVPY